MKKFIVIYHTPEAATGEAWKASPEEQAKGMEAWMTWAATTGDKLVDFGQPLGGGLLLTPGGGSTKSNKDVAGYSIIQAENMEDAKAILQGHPHLAWNADCSIEVHEAMAVPGM